MKHEEELLVNDYYTVSVIFDLNATNCLYTYKVDNSIDSTAVSPAFTLKKSPPKPA